MIKKGQEMVTRTFTKKDAEFNAIVKGLPKELKGVAPGAGTVIIDQYRYSGIMNYFNPNSNDYRYYADSDPLTPVSTATTYTNELASVLMKSPYSPQNITLQSIGMQSGGFFGEVSGSAKADAKCTSE